MREFDEELNRLSKEHRFYVCGDADHSFIDFTGPATRRKPPIARGRARWSSLPNT